VFFDSDSGNTISEFNDGRKYQSLSWSPHLKGKLIGFDEDRKTNEIIDMQKASLVKGSITPKWMIKQGGVAFGFGGKLARFTSNNQTDVDVIPFSSDR
jgi:hypothetical protein